MLNQPSTPTRPGHPKLDTNQLRHYSSKSNSVQASPRLYVTIKISQHGEWTDRIKQICRVIIPFGVAYRTKWQQKTIVSIFWSLMHCSLGCDL